MAAKYFGVLCLFIALCNSQKTPGFNDWTATGTEREIDLLYQDINSVKVDTSEIITSIDTFDAEANARNLQSKKKISDDISTAMNDVASEANKAGYPFCAAKANGFKFTAIAKYQTQIDSANDLYIISAFKTKSLAKGLSETLSVYKRKESAVASMRSCTGILTAIFGNTAIVNCYKRELVALTNDVKRFIASNESGNREFEDTKNRYNSLISVVSKTLSDAKTATESAVNEILDCANLNNNVDYAKELIEEIKLNISNSVKQQVKFFNEKTEKATNVLNNIALQYQENLKTQVILPLINAYEKTFSIIPNQYLSLNERIANVNKFFDGYKNYAMILFDGLRISKYETLKSLVKTADQNLDLAFVVFTLDVTKSKCIKTKKEVFLSCIDPVLKSFLANKTSAEKEIMTHESVVDFLVSLTFVSSRPTKRIHELLDSLKFDFEYQKYLVERSQLYLKTVVDATPSRVEVINKVNNFTDLVNSLNVNFQNTLQIVGDNPELKVYLSVQENKIKSKVDELNVLIESLKPKLQKAESEIKSQIETYKDFVVYCDGSAYKICVDTQYNAKDSKLSTAVNVFNNNAMDVATIQSKIENLKVEIEKTLKEAEEKAKLEKEKAMDIDARKQIVIDALKKYNNSLNEQTPAVDRIISIQQGATGVIKGYYDKAARNPNLNVVFQLGNVTFRKNFNDFGGCNSIDIIKGIIDGMGNHAQVLRQIENQSRSVSDSYLNEQCNNITLLTSYKDCLENQLVVPNLNITLTNQIFSTFYFEA